MILRAFQHKLAELLGSDVDTVRKIEAMDQRHREVGHGLRNIEQKLDPLRTMIEQMRDDPPHERQQNH